MGAEATEVEAEMVKCECCRLTEECTVAYIARVRERNGGRWICGLCVEVVKDEIMRSEALIRHMNFCKKLRALRPTEELISAVKQLMLRSLDSPRSSPVSRQRRCRSCFSAVDS
ncbi:uncharacterized protein [Nicotiana sylvestris]|uniref:Uncharacterized protein n=2 Tax=Nicotiana TaxID=4085 RepID=A0A1S4APR2_TOBAC|nr:PREDICTED: uncharacterized protein LOC104222384 [Nicotiana sylvestris]XP_016478679.1 PREDICTED: uncharacterized protein LOC107800053 [Nicotiana tabacum]